MTEQIWANELRFYRETAPRSGVPDGDVFQIPVGPAAAARRIETWGARVNVFRNPLYRDPLHDYHEGRMAFSVGTKFLGFLLASHMTNTGAAAWELDRNAPTPTFCLEVQTESDLFRYCGIGFSEMQITCTPPELVALDLAFIALTRETIVSLTDATADLYSEVVSANWCAAMYTTGGPWGLDPRSDNFLDGTFSVQWFLTRRDLAPAMFNFDGKPERLNSQPWRVMAEIVLNPSALTEQAKLKATGRLGFSIGAVGQSLDLLSDSVSMFNDSEPIKDVDFREETLMVEMHPNAYGSMLSLRDIGGVIP